MKYLQVYILINMQLIVYHKMSFPVVLTPTQWAKRISEDYIIAINLIPIEYINTMECKTAITKFIECMIYSDFIDEDSICYDIMSVQDFDKRVQFCIVIIEMGISELLKCIPSDIMCDDIFIDKMCEALEKNILVLLFIPREHHTFRLYSIAFQYKYVLYYYDDLMDKYITTTLDIATNNYFPKEINKIISAFLFHRTAEDIENLKNLDSDGIDFFK